MRSMVLMYSDPAQTKAMSAAERGAMACKHQALRTELTASGELLNGAGLAYPEDTTTLRLRDGVAVTDGPFADAAEHLTAYYLIECETPDRALSIAEGILDFHVTAVEVRQVHDSVGIDDLEQHRWAQNRNFRLLHDCALMPTGAGGGSWPDPCRRVDLFGWVKMRLNGLTMVGRFGQPGHARGEHRWIMLTEAGPRTFL